MYSLSWFRSQQYLILRKTWTINRTNKRSAVDVVHDIIGPNPAQSQKHIVVLHGLLGCKRNWKSLAEKLAAANNATVIAPDARNHGDSPHDSSHTYTDLASDVAQLMTKLSINAGHIIGHSMGGRTGMFLALTEPSKVSSLIVVDISPVPRAASILTDFFPKLIDVMKAVNFQDSDNVNKAKTAATQSMMSSGLISSVEGIAFILMNIGQLGNNSFGWKYNLDALKDNFTHVASFPSDMTGKQYPGPTLFIGGGQSDYLPKSDETVIKELFPQAEIKYIDHVGHNAHAEDPAAFLNIVNEFYSKKI